MLPLSGRRGQLLGLLIIERQQAFSEHHRSFVEALSGFAALTLESRELVVQQKRLFESFIQLLAEAVDAKSPHTGGHCHRVPILTEWLVELAANSDAPALPILNRRRDARSSTHRGMVARLRQGGHPEYVVDKATKLETCTTGFTKSGPVSRYVNGKWSWLTGKRHTRKDCLPLKPSNSPSN
jgi:hypothetical protein